MRPVLLITLLLTITQSQEITIHTDFPYLVTFLQDDEYYGSSRNNSNKDLITKNYRFDIQDIGHLEASFDFAMGDLEIKAGQDDIITGSFKYDSLDYKPKISYETFGTKGIFKARTKSLRHYYDDEGNDHDSDHDYEDDGKRFHIELGDLDDEHVRQELDFQFPPDIPTSMKFEFGLGKADIDLTDLAIAGLELECGLSDVRLSIDEPNSTKCKEVYIESGLGDFNGYGLGYLRAKYINLDVGLGSAYVDLSKQKYDLVGDIEVALGSLELVLPEKANIKIRVDDTFLSSVDVDEMVKTGHKEWSTPDWKSKQPSIELDISIGLGSVDVDLIK